MSQLALKIIREEHAALSAMLRSLALMIERGPGDQPERFFDVLRAMLFYIDEFPERMHHPKESDLLFPRLGDWAMLKILPGSDQWHPTSSVFPEEVMRAGYFDETWENHSIVKP